MMIGRTAERQKRKRILTKNHAEILKIVKIAAKSENMLQINISGMVGKTYVGTNCYELCLQLF